MGEMDCPAAALARVLRSELGQIARADGARDRRARAAGAAMADSMSSDNMSDRAMY
jgi:hypothetical protein